ncbi:MAG: zinc ribbon domain-containing protein [Polyangiaceae bacterium]|nr:zinc ribbon domain-containing protein [Polyangiaceae bacterium]
MPTYDYACAACGHAWEEEQRITADAIEQCPKCGEKTAKRQISGGAAFILKGGGWYSDLYSSSGASKKADASASATPSSTPSTPSSGASASTPSAPAAPSSSTPSSGSTGGS